MVATGLAAVHTLGDFMKINCSYNTEALTRLRILVQFI